MLFIYTATAAAVACNNNNNYNERFSKIKKKLREIKQKNCELTNTNKFFSHIYDSTFFFEGSIGLNICFEVSVEQQAVVDIHSKGIHLVRKIKKENSVIYLKKKIENF